MKNKTSVKSSVMGVIVGDALGVPYEGMKKGSYYVYEMEDSFTQKLKRAPHGQPKGSYSDDGSLTLAVMDALMFNTGLYGLIENRRAWFDDGKFTQLGKAFGSGLTTRVTIDNFNKGMLPHECGLTEPERCGNGTLMSISSFAMMSYGKTDEEIIAYLEGIHSTSHNQPINIISTFFYVSMMHSIMSGEDIKTSVEFAQDKMVNVILKMDRFSPDAANFDRLSESYKYLSSPEGVLTTGYVIHSLEASIYCLITTNTYEECILKAVNIGGDVDTIAAIVGGAAGLYYGYDAIPERWISEIIDREELEKLCDDVEELIAEGSIDLDLLRLEAN